MSSKSTVRESEAVRAREATESGIRPCAPELGPWTERLESDPEWSEGLRGMAQAFERPPSDFVLLIAPPDHLPRGARGAHLVHDFHVAIGWVADVPCEVPCAYLPSMSATARARDPEYSHALVFAPPLTDSIRFRVPR